MAKREKAIVRPLYRALGDYAAQLGYKNMLYLNIGEPDFPTPVHIVEAAKTALDHGFTHYTQERGLLELRQTIAEKMKAEKGLDINPEQCILITGGGLEAVYISIMSMVDIGDEVIVLDPYYPPYASAVIIAEGKPRPVPVDEDTLMPDSEQVAASVTPKTKAIIVNSPCNPTGMVYGKRILKSIAEIAEDNDLYVISDEVYDCFLYEGEECPSITAFKGMFERTIFINSFSKTYAMTGWRIGYLASTAENVEKILKIKGSLNVCASSIAQKAAIAALKSKEDSVKEMLSEYDKRRRLVLDSLSHIRGFKCSVPRGAFYIFPDISAVERDSLKYCRYLIKEAHVVVSPGAAFGAAGEGHIRISYASSQQNLKEALERVKGATEIYEV